MRAHDLKLRRAEAHLRELRSEVERWREVDGYTITVHSDPEPPNYSIRAEGIREPEESLALLVGDCLHNARAALEYIVFALGEQGAGRQMSEAEARRSTFPIVGDLDADGFAGRGPELFDQRAARALSTVEPEAVAAIKNLQPYTDDDIWDYNGLWILHELARVDRHRFLHFGAVRSEGLQLDRSRCQNIKVEGRIDVLKGPVVPGEEDTVELGRIVVHPTDPKKPVQMHFTDGLDLTLETGDIGLDAADGRAVDSVLEDCVFDVRQAIRELSRFLVD